MTCNPHTPPPTTSRPPQNVTRTRDAYAAQPSPPRPNPAHASGHWGAPPPPGNGAGRGRYDGARQVPLNGTVARRPPPAQRGLPMAGSGHIVIQPPAVYTNTIALVAPKSVGVAFLLTFFFGPLGLLYATVTGGLIMLAVSFVAFFFSIFLLGIPTLFAWIACIVWGCTAASAHNNRMHLAPRGLR